MQIPRLHLRMAVNWCAAADAEELRDGLSMFGLQFELHELHALMARCTAPSVLPQCSLAAVADCRVAAGTIPTAMARLITTNSSIICSTTIGSSPRKLSSRTHSRIVAALACLLVLCKPSLVEPKVPTNRGAKR